jgi:hypothetical protein
MMEEERREPDPTRKLLKIFGVKVTDYEERTRGLLQRAQQAHTGDERAALLAETLELTADLNKWLREITNHVLETESRVLSTLSAELGSPR